MYSGILFFFFPHIIEKKRTLLIKWIFLNVPCCLFSIFAFFFSCCGRMYDVRWFWISITKKMYFLCQSYLKGKQMLKGWEYEVGYMIFQSPEKSIRLFNTLHTFFLKVHFLCFLSFFFNFLPLKSGSHPSHSHLAFAENA